MRTPKIKISFYKDGLTYSKANVLWIAKKELLLFLGTKGEVTLSSSAAIVFEAESSFWGKSSGQENLAQTQVKIVSVCG